MSDPRDFQRKSLEKHRDFQKSIEMALLLVRTFRLHCIAQRLDPRAVRVVLKFMLLADSEFALKALSAEDEAHLDKLAHDLLKQAIENERKGKGGD